MSLVGLSVTGYTFRFCWALCALPCSHSAQPGHESESWCQMMQWKLKFRFLVLHTSKFQISWAAVLFFRGISDTCLPRNGYAWTPWSASEKKRLRSKKGAVATSMMAFLRRNRFGPFCQRCWRCLHKACLSSRLPLKGMSVLSLKWGVRLPLKWHWLRPLPYLR